jgi:hypothetical protein
MRKEVSDELYKYQLLASDSNSRNLSFYYRNMTLLTANSQQNDDQCISIAMCPI